MFLIINTKSKYSEFDWQEDNYIEDHSYKDVEYYGALESEFHTCTFLNTFFYWNLFNITEFKNCTFAGVTFNETVFFKCTFLNCTFTKGNIGSHCTADNSYAVDCFIDEQSLKKNPLTIQLLKDTLLLTPKLKKEIFKTFKSSRPELAVDEPKHCLSCDETQETHEKIANLKHLNVDHFNICFMSVETCSEEAFLYYMPKLFELFLLGKENEWDSFQIGFLRQLVPNKFGDRFKNYNKEQIQLIIKVLKLFYNKA